MAALPRCWMNKDGGRAAQTRRLPVTEFAALLKNRGKKWDQVHNISERYFKGIN